MSIYLKPQHKINIFDYRFSQNICFCAFGVWRLVFNLGVQFKVLSVIGELMRSKNNIMRHERVLDAFSGSLLRRGSTVRLFMLKNLLNSAVGG